MIYIKPSFYDSFRCIADKCTDSCCVGWEINIDNETIDVYKNMQTEFGGKIRKNIVKNEDDTYSFKLLEGERCPFLNKNNLAILLQTVVKRVFAISVKSIRVSIMISLMQLNMGWGFVVKR